MRRLSMFIASFTALVLLATSALAHPGDGLTDDPRGHEGHDDHAHEDTSPLFHGGAHSSVSRPAGENATSPRHDRRARNIQMIGHTALDTPNINGYGDVAGYKNLAFIGKWRGDCPGDGVDIIDISRPARPVKISSTLGYADTSMEDMQAIAVGGRDILAIGLQDCGNSPTQGTVGLELYDITDPRNPVLLSLFNGADFGRSAALGHVHELDLTSTPSGRTLALLSSPNLEANTATAASGFTDGIGDMLVVDITDPAEPFLLSDWGVLGGLEDGLDVYLDSQQGGDARTLLHSVRANVNGTRAYLSYWDAGYIILDLSDPANPVYVGRTQYAPGEEGNAHSVDEARGGNILLAADEDFSPFSFTFTSSAFSGERTAVEASFSPQIVEQPGREMTGTVVHLGRGCPAGSITETNPDDPYLADPAGKIALIERGGCRFDHKVARAQQAGATGVIIYNNAPGLLLPGGNNPTIMPDGSRVPITIPVISVEQSTGLLLRDGSQPVTASAAAVFDGWGYLRIFDISDPANPKQVSTFATENTFNEAVATQGTWSVHNPEVRGSTAYLSWYNDGVRVLDISNPRVPREIGFWTGAGAPAAAPPVDIWSVVPHGDLLLASDRNYGLYILKQTKGQR
jgi:hypothetical protein